MPEQPFSPTRVATAKGDNGTRVHVHGGRVLFLGKIPPSVENAAHLELVRIRLKSLQILPFIVEWEKDNVEVKCVLRLLLVHVALELKETIFSS